MRMAPLRSHAPFSSLHPAWSASLSERQSSWTKTGSGISETKSLANSCQKVLFSAFFERKRGRKKKLCADRGPPLEQARLTARLACGSLIRTVFSEATVLRFRKFERRGFFTRCSSRTSFQRRSFSVLVHEPCVPVGKLAK